MQAKGPDKRRTAVGSAEPAARTRPGGSRWETTRPISRLTGLDGESWFIFPLGSDLFCQYCSKRRYSHRGHYLMAGRNGRIRDFWAAPP